MSTATARKKAPARKKVSATAATPVAERETPIRFGIVLSASAHRKIKAQCALEGVNMGDAIGKLIEAAYGL